MKLLDKIFLLLTAAVLLPSWAAAEYSADSDTGIEALDYIERKHRTERENALTEEQKKLLADVETMRQNLRKPVDPKKASPVAFEGDDLTYYENTGDFVAKGRVKILQLEGNRFESELVKGNVKEERIEAPDKIHLLRLTKDDKSPKVILDGYRAKYDYGNNTGSLEEVIGKVDHHYITGKRFVFYPDHIVIYEGTETKCSAKKPDYHSSAEIIEIWPDDKIILHQAKFWIGKWMVAKKKYHEAKIGSGAGETVYPRLGYNNDDGLYIRYDQVIPLTPHFTATGHYYIDTNRGIRSYADVTYQNKNTQMRVEYGYFEDSDDRWIQKQPSFIYEFNKHMHGAPLSYKLSYEIGRWQDDGLVSTHQRYGLDFNHDPIKFDKNYTLYLHTGYSVTKESEDDSMVRGIGWDAVMTKDFDDRWAAFGGYHYTKDNAQDALFKFDKQDYARKLEGGFSYRFNDRDRFAVGLGYDVMAHRVHDVDYYWYHDVHCSQLIFRYRAKRNSVQVRWQFTPW